MAGRVTETPHQVVVIVCRHIHPEFLNITHRKTTMTSPFITVCGGHVQRLGKSSGHSESFNHRTQWKLTERNKSGLVQDFCSSFPAQNLLLDFMWSSSQSCSDWISSCWDVYRRLQTDMLAQHHSMWSNSFRGELKCIKTLSAAVTRPHWSSQRCTLFLFYTSQLCAKKKTNEKETIARRRVLLNISWPYWSMKLNYKI